MLHAQPPSIMPTVQSLEDLCPGTAFCCFADLRAGSNNLKDHLCSREPHKVDWEAITNTTEEDPILIIAKMADDFDCDHEITSRLVKK
ncbi:hypothetical protein KIN20_022821 [Parelaphostrongylus tenuis]|uniref:Uncharacterized protein n=1 Tax=Parelaphostrongylus tenuis TaxID=148309 RepID=A0AAD5QSI8_PARTN|nr:hypothetical protein KIN20_022821 [Parelaphostrongylus tenuis]